MSFLTRFTLLLLLLPTLLGFPQNKWDLINPISIQKNKNVLRESFPKTFNVCFKINIHFFSKLYFTLRKKNILK